MQKIINAENIRNFAYENSALIKGKIRGIVLDFRGLGFTSMAGEGTKEGEYFAENGAYYAEKNVLFVTPYYNPWSWMNRQAVAFVDEILDVLFARHDLHDNTPIVSSGDSMGGLCSLVYARYASRTPACCVANCPVCDLPFHYGERPDLPRTLYSAFFGYDGDLCEALKTASPIHLAGEMPKIPYFIFHCGCDKLVNLQTHSVRFVDAMKALGHEIHLEIVPGRAHCDLPKDVRELFRRRCADAACGSLS